MGETQTPALLLRDFVNTLDVETGRDELATPPALESWLTERGLTTAAAASESDLAAALALREGLRTAMLHHGPEPPAELERALGAFPLRVTFAGTAPALVPLATGVQAGLARIAAAVMASAADGTWPRLKACQELTCQWAFLDTSKNRSRAWCSMRVCGNRTKTRAYRARRRTTPGPP
ncbi:CGNR zinc finger domain-containing protein [Spirillospora sp. CA-294931]|uniref:CGNR zinc finger domain-containing protein n=1 Tax=Spirillospora sp. CA-294931 TaxID=3240042 RepID=UPI003D93E554